MLKLKNVSKYYAKDGVITSGFTKVNLELHLGEFVVITGESGSGKSTLLNVLSGLDSYEDGEMYINGEETSHFTEEDYLAYRRKCVSNIFQNFNLVNSYTVFENIELALLMNGNRKKEIKKSVLELIEKVGLKKYQNTLVSKLSGGQKQRVAIARALANDTPIIVCDEPTGSLDSKASREIIELLHKISKNKLIIVVTHNKEEIEKYATRLLRMHDGKILEDKIVEEINLDDDLKSKDVKSITFLNRVYLGIKNAFNLPIKFTLMFVIFLLISIALLTNYGLFQASKYESDTLGYNEYFMESDDSRVILKKEDGSVFTANDYEKIKTIDTIDRLVENDLILDFDLGFYSNNLYLYGVINTDEIKKVDLGRLPENDNEIVIKGSKENWYFETYQELIFDETFTLELYDSENKNNDIKVVGIIYDEDNNSYSENFEFFMSDTLLKEVNTSLNEHYYKINYIINDTYVNYYFYYGIQVSDKLNAGEIIVGDIVNNYCKDFNCKNNKFTIGLENIYVKDDYEFTIDKIYNYDNCKNILGISYDDADGRVFISQSDYDRLFRRENYQSSIFVKDLKDLNDTILKLEEMGFKTFKLKDAKYNEGAEIMKILNIFELVVTVVLIVVLFFISYFIIKIIYKSRNSYYTTLRTLGGTKMVCVSILRNELVCLASITYLSFLFFIYLVNTDILNISYFKEITKYLGLFEYFIIYVILIFISVLISRRYGKKIFKESIIKTYGERI